MFFKEQTEIQKDTYEIDLKIIGSLSNLFSDSDVPYLYYRIAEKIFCNSFNASDLSRGDVALDAYKDGLGIGLKTFLQGNSRNFQKVAEFNKDRYSYEKLKDRELIESIAYLRNERITFTENLYNIEKSIYHCVIRDKNKFRIHEESMDTIDIANIKNIKRKRNTIHFNDNKHDYSFNLTKSTLMKRFNTAGFFHEFDVNILKNPLSEIKNCFMNRDLLYGSQNIIMDSIYLPLYGRKQVVFPNSGLNQWNANGRDRDVNEVYIPIPIKVHQIKENFFPPRDKQFNLKLPTGDILITKVCQDNSKALMSYHNKDLGIWILRKVLKLNEGELLTYSRLQIIGIDSVRIDKINEGNYEINFTSLNSYEKFIDDN